MGHYLIILLLLFVFSIVDFLNNKNESIKLNLLRLILCYIPLIILLITRLVGFDYDSYESAYNHLHYYNFKDIFDDVQFEPGYILLNMLSPSYLFLIAIIGVTTLLIKFKVIVIISPYPIVTLLFFFLAHFLNFEMGQMRQALAMSITLFSILYFSNKKRFLLMVLLAALFHYSALSFLVLLIFPRTIKRAYFYIGLLFLAVLLFFTIEPFIFKFSGYLPGFSEDKLIGYYEEEQGSLGISISLLTFRIALLMLFFFLKKKILELDKTIYEHFFNIYFLSLFIYIAFAFFPQVSGRLGAYFAIFDIFLIPIILRVINVFELKFFVFLLFIAIYLFVFLNFLNTWGISFIPYKSWLF